MKRAILSTVAVLLAGIPAGCSPAAPEGGGGGAGGADTEGWARPPVVVGVHRTGADLVVSGVAQRQGRVVLRSDDGQAFAASADERGRFEIGLPAPGRALLLRPETQVGEDAAPSPDRLLVLPGRTGPVAVLRLGGPTRRLDTAPALGAIDSDAGMRLASGQAPRGAARVEVQSGSETVQVVPDASGRWSVMLPPRKDAEEIRVAGRVFVWPGEAPPSPSLSVDRAGEGWRVRWSGPGGARQSTWLPDPAS